MIEIKVKRTAPKLKFENSILDNVEKYNIAKNLSAYFIGIILMGNNIGNGLLSDCGTIHADFQKENNIIFVREIKKIPQ